MPAHPNLQRLIDWGYGSLKGSTVKKLILALCIMLLAGC